MKQYPVPPVPHLEHGQTLRPIREPWPVPAPQQPLGFLDVTTVTFTAYGDPQPKGSTRAFAMPIKGDPKGRYRAVTTSANKKLKPWSAEMRVAAREAAGDKFFRGPIRVTVEFGLVRPKSVKEKKRPYPSVKPDLDKLVRATIDTLSGVLFEDDAQVVAVQATKVYSTGAAYTMVIVQEH